MSSFSIFEVAGSGLNAQNLRLNLISSNLANADSISSSLDEVYRSRHPVFAAQLKNILDKDNPAVAVKTLGVIENDGPLRTEYAPDHPMANEEGYIFRPNVNVIEEMANMMSASRSYRNNVEVMNTAKQLMLQTLRIGQ